MPETFQPSHEDLVKALIHESEEVQSGVARAQGALYTSSGIILPLLTGVFVIAAKEAISPPALRVLALVFVVTPHWRNVVTVSMDGTYSLHYLQTFGRPASPLRGYRSSKSPELS